MSAHLELDGLTRIFGTRPAQALEALRAGMDKASLLAETGHAVGVHDVSLTIGKGELFVVMGLSGSGKSTLVRLINRLIEPTSGSVRVDGRDITGMSRRDLVALRRHTMSMVFQSFALLPNRSVLDNVAFGLEVAGVPRREARGRALEALALVGIADVAHRRPEQLSGGMQQRVGLARAWVTHSDILLMDEAFSALDPLIRTEMQDALLALQATQRRTIVFISHDISEAVRIADRVAVMADGEIRQVGSPVEIVGSPADEYVRAFFRDVQPGRLFKAADIALPGDVASVGGTVAGDTLLEDLLPLAAANESPLRVTGTHGDLIGYIDRAALLNALSKGRAG